jgi:formate hydrogenlyase subunit 6/NADH:ubiquinone oxidoreductase subunit I/predicted flap endonuclease-1-like 5' DNA nuclease
MNRCTSCGICAKVCPPQCIWIVRTNDPKTGKPIPQPAEFYIDTDICMNCGYCAEFCPFDAIKMDHDFELADYERTVAHVHDIYRLTKPVSYYASIRPTWNALEEATRLAAEEEKRRKDEEKQRLAAEKAAAAKAQSEVKEEEAPAAPSNGQAEADGQPKKKTPEEIKAQREAMLARKQQRGLGEEAVPAAAETTAEAPAPVETPVAEAKADSPAPVQAPDDLEKIEGIGPRISAVLKETGITTFAQLAKTDTSQLKQVLEKAGPRFQMADPTSWPAQAELAAAGKWTEFEALQQQLQGGRHRE